MNPLPVLAAVILQLSAPVSHSALPQRVGLEGAWRLTQRDRGISVPARVPGLVDTDLMAAGTISDPFYRDNGKAVQWVGEVPWTYSRTFSVSADFVRHRHIVLRCDGLDTLADIHVNGAEIAHTDNMFRTWEFDVRPLLHAGRNTITISLDPVEPYLKAHVNQTAFPDKPVTGWGYIRKPPFQQGWDFAPKLITCGIWKQIGLIGWDEGRLMDVGVIQDHRPDGSVGLDVDVAADGDAALTAHVAVLFGGKTVAQADGGVSDGAGVVRLTIVHPQLWWPAGMGPQNLYEVHVALRDKGGALVGQETRRIGLRTITWIPKTDTTPLTFAVNGHRFFAKGSNWVPPDALMTRVTAATERRYIDDAVDAHMNMMRLWGGGYYDDDAFYDEADKKGLLLWSEFKFADAAYPAFDPAWIANVRAEAEDTVRRLRNHPSLAVWSGNNEVIGFVADKTDADHMTHEDYDLLFHHVLAGVAHDLSPGVLYTPGSPESGDDHDWSVWHGSAGFESYRDVHGFMSEFGFQAFPQPKSIAEFTTASDRASVVSPVMEYHQRNWRDGNLLILNTIKQYYRQPKDFDSTLWLSQIQQADGILTGVEHWRRDWPNSTGSLVWQYNDCWPSISWSMMDYYGRPKALWYRLHHAYAPVMLSGQTDGSAGNAELWVSNDRMSALRGTVLWTLTRVDGTPLEHGSRALTIPTGTSSVRALSLALGSVVGTEGSGNLLLWAQLNVPGEPVSSTVLTFAKPKDINLVAPDIRARVTQIGSDYRVVLSAAHPALRSWLDLTGLDARFSDNFVDLRPGVPSVIIVTPAVKTSLAQIRKALRVRSLYDTYLPGTEAEPITTAELDGTIIATADNAEIQGNGAIVETGTPDNIGDWADVNASLQWTVKGAKAGAYTVSINLACPPDEEGSEYVVDVAGQRLSGVVPGTASWTDYTTVVLGTVEISKAGTVQILLTPKSMPHMRIMNLRTLTLKPLNS